MHRLHIYNLNVHFLLCVYVYMCVTTLNMCCVNYLSMELCYNMYLLSITSTCNLLIFNVISVIVVLRGNFNVAYSFVRYGSVPTH